MRSGEEISFKNSFIDGFKSPITLGCAALAIPILATIGPFGMYEVEPFPRRLLYWIIIIPVSFALAIALISASRTFCPSLNQSLCRVLMSLSFSAIFTPFVYALNWNFFPARWDSMLGWPTLMVFNATIFFGIILIVSVVRDETLTKHSAARIADPTSEEMRRPRFFDRLEDCGPSDLIRLEMQDHYVEAHTSKGSSLILLRMSDAVAELEGFNGLQVHRSHWVARQGVVGSEMVRAKRFLVMRDGARVPVSRTFRAKARDAGLF